MDVAGSASAPAGWRRALQRRLVAQFHRPHGALGRLAGFVLAHRPSNVQRNRWTVDLLELAPTDRVLELGFGPGVALAEVARRVPRGRVVGVDHSETMAGVAGRRNARALAEGRLTLHVAAFDALPSFDEPFDAIFAVNAVMFAGDAPALLRDLHARLRPGGRIAVTFQSRRPGATHADSLRGGEETAEHLRRAGFEDVRSEVLRLEPVSAVCVLGRRAASPSPAAGAAGLSAG